MSHPSDCCHRGSLLVLGLSMAMACHAAEPAPAEPAPAAGATNWPALELSLEYVGKYVSRGLVYTPDPVLQPTVAAEWYGFRVEFWGNLDTTGVNDREWEWLEEDYTVSYSHTVGPVTLEAGLTYYRFPAASPRVTKEWFGRIGLDDWPLAPAVTAYYDWDEAHGAYINPTIEHTFSLIDEKLDLVLAGGVGWGSPNYNEFYTGMYHSGWFDVTASATLDYSLTQHLTVSPFVAWSELLDPQLTDQVELDPNDGGLGQSSCQVWGGLRLSVEF